jgi:hypothetical protein
MASVLMSSKPVVAGRSDISVFAGWKASGMKARKPPEASCCSRRRTMWSTRSGIVSMWP